MKKETKGNKVKTQRKTHPKERKSSIKRKLPLLSKKRITKSKPTGPGIKRKTPAKRRITPIQVAAKPKRAVAEVKNRVVRIMGQGQFTVDSRTLKKLNEIDNSIVELVSNERADDIEFKKRLVQLSDIVTKSGKPLDPKEIIQSDIILPSADLSVDEAKKLFRGEGVVPDI